MKIAVYSPNWIGDAVMALPFVQQLKIDNKDSEIFIFCKEWVSGVYKNHPAVSQIIPIRDKDLNGLMRMIRTGSSLKPKGFDRFYTLTDSFRSAFIIWLSGAEKRYGYKTQFRSVFLTNISMIPKGNIHRHEKYLRLIQAGSIYSNIPKIHLSTHEIEWAEKEIDQLGFKNPIALFPFSVASNRTIPNQILKNWLNASGDQYLVFGSKNDIGSAKTLINTCEGAHIKSICGKYDLRESIALISACKFSLATDSGLGHVSTALGIPTVSFFGVGVESKTAPIGKNNVVIKYCNPCMGGSCTWQNKDRKCIREISRSDIDFAINSIANL